jgi:predicted Fe-Mo cluster-binding NifX family protein
MKVAVPIADGKLCLHFGHCQYFAIFDMENGAVTGRNDVAPPPHAPGVIPRFLNEQDVAVILAGGMGQKALELFDQFNIQVVIGAPAVEPLQAVEDYLKGSLQTGANVCDH